MKPDRGTTRPAGDTLREPEWRGLASCDFCGSALTQDEQLSGACAECQRKLTESRRER